MWAIRHKKSGYWYTGADLSLVAVFMSWRANIWFSKELAESEIVAIEGVFSYKFKKKPTEKLPEGVHDEESWYLDAQIKKEDRELELVEFKECGVAQ